MLLRRGIYNLLLRHTMDKTIARQRPHKEEISLFLKHRYGLALTQKNKDKAKEDKPEEAPEAKFDVKPPKGTRDFYPDQMAIRRKVIDTVVGVFRKHGAV